MNYANEIATRNGISPYYNAEQVERTRQFVNGTLPLSASGFPDTTVPQDLLIAWTGNLLLPGKMHIHQLLRVIQIGIENCIRVHLFHKPIILV